MTWGVVAAWAIVVGLVMLAGYAAYRFFTAERCPKCGAGRGECRADYDGVADYRCYRCGHWWQGPGRSDPPGW